MWLTDAVVALLACVASVARLLRAIRVAAWAAALPAARAWLTNSNFCTIRAGSLSGRPNRVPDYRAAAIPALTRSTMSSRLHSAKVASMFSINPSSRCRRIDTVRN